MHEQAGKANPRILWIDAAKGVAISLVVFGHVIGGALARRWLEPAPTWTKVYEFIYLFHMPLFFLVSGMFCVDTMRRNPGKAFASLFRSIAWPYFVWEVGVRASLLPLMKPFMLTPSDPNWIEWLGKALRGDLSWFLWTLFVTQLVLIPIAWLPTWLLLLGSLILFGVADASWMGNLASVAMYLPYLLCGGLARGLLDRWRTVDWWPVIAAICVFPLLAGALVLGWTEPRPVRLLCGVAGSIALLVLVRAVDRSAMAAAFGRLGVASLAIYVLHPYFQGAARAAAYAVAGASALLQVWGVTLVAIIGAYGIYACAERFRFEWLFRLRAPGNIATAGAQPSNPMPSAFMRSSKRTHDEKYP